MKGKGPKEKPTFALGETAKIKPGAKKKNGILNQNTLSKSKGTTDSLALKKPVRGKSQDNFD